MLAKESPTSKTTMISKSVVCYSESSKSSPAGMTFASYCTRKHFSFQKTFNIFFTDPKMKIIKNLLFYKLEACNTYCNVDIVHNNRKCFSSISILLSTFTLEFQFNLKTEQCIYHQHSLKKIMKLI